MLITCPSCASQYTIAPARLGSAGSDVRCAQCDGTWYVAAPAATVAPPPALPASRSARMPVTIDGTASARRAAAASVPTGRADVRAAGRGRLLLSGITLLCAALAAPAAIAMRGPIVRAVPGSAGIFAAIGLPVNVLGLALEDVSSGLRDEGGAPVLVVEGLVRGAGPGEVAVPRIAFRIEGSDGTELYGWTTKPPVPRIAAGDGVRFVARLAAPPPDGRRVSVNFDLADGSRAMAAR